MQCERSILSSMACPTLQYFSTLSHKRHNFRRGGERIIEHKMYFEFIYNVCLKYFVLRRIQRDLFINLHRFPCKVHVILVTAQTNLNFFARFSKKKKLTSNFVKISPIGEELLHADGRTDR